MPALPIRSKSLWAKSDRTAGSPAYHPLICHLIDIAMVTRTLWDRVIPETLQERVSFGLGATSPDFAGQVVSYLAGLHDIGKASPGFQRKSTAGWQRVRDAGFSVPIEPRDVGHGTVTALALQQILTDPAFGGLSSKMVARHIAPAIGGAR